MKIDTALPCTCGSKYDEAACHADGCYYKRRPQVEAAFNEARAVDKALIERLVEALRPFAEYTDPRGKVPSDLVITSGSSLAKRQLQMSDCYEARAALAAAERCEACEATLADNQIEAEPVVIDSKKGYLLSEDACPMCGVKKADRAAEQKEEQDS